MPLRKYLLAGSMLSAVILAHPPGELRAQTTPSATSRIGRIDESSFVALAGNRHPLAIPANDRGEAAPDLPMERMLLVLTRDATSETALENLLAAQQDKSSPDFHAWFRPRSSARDLALQKPI